MKVYLGNLAGVSSNTMASVIAILNGYYNRVVSGTGVSFGGVVEVTKAPSISTSDILCYIVSDFSNSVLINWNSALQHNDGDAGETCFTNDKKQAASEVYMDIINGNSDVTDFLANIIFHESMHNRTTTGDELHKSADGLAKETVTESDTLTAANIKTMQGSLSKAVTQWVGGF